MHRSLQNQLLAWLAALSVLGAALRPTFDTILFAIAFVFGTTMVFVRERLEPRETRTVDSLPHLAGRLLGASIAWGVVGLRQFHGSATGGAWTHRLAALGARAPARLTTEVLIAAAAVPSAIVLFEGGRALLLRRGRARLTREEAREK